MSAVGASAVADWLSAFEAVGGGWSIGSDGELRLGWFKAENPHRAQAARMARTALGNRDFMAAIKGALGAGGSHAGF